MKIIIDKNLAFSDQPKPIPAGEIAKRIKPRKPVKPIRSTRLEMSLFLPALGRARMIPLVDRAALAANEMKVVVENFRPGVHVFGPGMEAKEIQPLGNKSAKFAKALEIAANLPDHLELRPTPRSLPAKFRTPPFMQTQPLSNMGKGANLATTIFAPDNRRIFNDTAYPWCTCGRVDTPGGQASGVMVGPRHMLTVSHTIQWNADGTAGWVRFRPSYFDGSAPFGEAWGTRVYFKRKVTGPTIDWIEGMYDYVVVVLNNRIGNITGWMGSRGYTDSWDGGTYWSHIGYPGDLSAGNRPSFQNGIALDGAWWELDSHEAMAHRGDVWPGQSGGPFFGWWSGDVGPRAVGVQSSQNSSENNASGGQDMVDLIIRATNENP